MRNWINLLEGEAQTFTAYASSPLKEYDPFEDGIAEFSTLDDGVGPYIHKFEVALRKPLVKKGTGFFAEDMKKYFGMTMERGQALGMRIDHLGEPLFRIRDNKDALVRLAGLAGYDGIVIPWSTQSEIITWESSRVRFLGGHAVSDHSRIDPKQGPLFEAMAVQAFSVTQTPAFQATHLYYGTRAYAEYRARDCQTPYVHTWAITFSKALDLPDAIADLVELRDVLALTTDDLHALVEGSRSVSWRDNEGRYIKAIGDNAIETIYVYVDEIIYEPVFQRMVKAAGFDAVKFKDYDGESGHLCYLLMSNGAASHVRTEMIDDVAKPAKEPTPIQDKKGSMFEGKSSFRSWIDQRLEPFKRPSKMFTYCDDPLKSGVCVASPAKVAQSMSADYRARRGANHPDIDPVEVRLQNPLLSQEIMSVSDLRDLGLADSLIDHLLTDSDFGWYYDGEDYYPDEQPDADRDQVYLDWFFACKDSTIRTALMRLGYDGLVFYSRHIDGVIAAIYDPTRIRAI